MISTPVAASSARILRPSRPIIRPLISSESMWKIETAFSVAVSVATHLNRLYHDLFSFHIGSHFSFLHDLVDIRDGFCLCFFFQRVDQFFLLPAHRTYPEMASSCSICCFDLVQFCRFLFDQFFLYFYVALLALEFFPFALYFFQFARNIGFPVVLTCFRPSTAYYFWQQPVFMFGFDL